MKGMLTTMDGNEAAAHVAYRTSEVIAIYPITPASPMGEFSIYGVREIKKTCGVRLPAWSNYKLRVAQRGTVHGALQTGALTTTFTASQGLLLMIPNMYNIAGELTPTVFHIAARSGSSGIVYFWRSLRCDGGSCNRLGDALFELGPEVMDQSVISHAATLQSRIPFLHIFDGFRTSHELSKIEVIPDSVLEAMMDQERIQEHRARGMTPDLPTMRGTAQNPDVYFQARESVNPFYDVAPEKVQEAMDQFALLTGRQYHLFDYVGHPEAERLIILMGSGAETVHEPQSGWLREAKKLAY